MKYYLENYIRKTMPRIIPEEPGIIPNYKLTISDSIVSHYSYLMKKNVTLSPIFLLSSKIIDIFLATNKNTNYSPYEIIDYIVAYYNLAVTKVCSSIKKKKERNAFIDDIVVLINGTLSSMYMEHFRCTDTNEAFAVILSRNESLKEAAKKTIYGEYSLFTYDLSLMLVSDYHKLQDYYVRNNVSEYSEEFFENNTLPHFVE